MSKHPDWFNLCAREIGGLPETWQWFQISAVGRHPNYQGTMVKGAIPLRFKTRGPLKGYPNWRITQPGSQAEIFVSNEAVDAQKARFEAETGKCSRCYGESNVPWRWSKDKGSESKPCPRCEATGKAP